MPRDGDQLRDEGEVPCEITFSLGTRYATSVPTMSEDPREQLQKVEIRESFSSAMAPPQSSRILTIMTKQTVVGISTVLAMFHAAVVKVLISGLVDMVAEKQQCWCTRIHTHS